MVFNSDNVWANIQPKSSNICYTSFDFNDEKCWRPFFGEGRLNLDKLSTCQKDESGNTEITYYNPNMKTLWDESKESADERKKFMMVRAALSFSLAAGAAAARRRPRFRLLECATFDCSSSPQS